LNFLMFLRRRLATICAPTFNSAGASGTTRCGGAIGSTKISAHSMAPLNSWYFFCARRPVAMASSALPHKRLARQSGTARRRPSPSARYSAASAARRSS